MWSFALLVMALSIAKLKKFVALDETFGYVEDVEMDGSHLRHNGITGRSRKGKKIPRVDVLCLWCEQHIITT